MLSWQQVPLSENEHRRLNTASEFSQWNRLDDNTKVGKRNIWRQLDPLSIRSNLKELSHRKEVVKTSVYKKGKKCWHHLKEEENLRGTGNIWSQWSYRQCWCVCFLINSDVRQRQSFHSSDRTAARNLRICKLLTFHQLKMLPVNTTAVKWKREKQWWGSLRSPWLPVAPQDGAWRAPRTQSSHWGRKTRSAAAPEAAVVWSEPTEENPGCSCGTAHQPRRTWTHIHSSMSWVVWEHGSTRVSALRAG